MEWVDISPVFEQSELRILKKTKNLRHSLKPKSNLILFRIKARCRKNKVKYHVIYHSINIIVELHQCNVYNAV